MKIGISVSTCPTKFAPITLSDDDFSSNIELARLLGYGGVDVFVDDKSDMEIEAMKEVLAANDLEVAMYVAISLAETGANLSDPDPINRRNSIERFKRQIQATSRLRSRSMPIGFVRGNPVDGEETRYHLDRLAESVRELIKCAAGMGVVVCLEPINRYETGSVHRVEEAVDFIRRYELNGLKVLPDLFHMNIEEVSIEQALEKCGSLIGHVHIADSNRMAPGQGHLAYRSIFETLRRLEYDGYLSVEAFPKPSGEVCAQQGILYVMPILRAIAANDNNTVEPEANKVCKPPLEDAWR